MVSENRNRYRKIVWLSNLRLFPCHPDLLIAQEFMPNPPLCLKVASDILFVRINGKVFENCMSRFICRYYITEMMLSTPEALYL